MVANRNAQSDACGVLSALLHGTMREPVSFKRRTHSSGLVEKPEPDFLLQKYLYEVHQAGRVCGDYLHGERKFQKFKE